MNISPSTFKEFPIKVETLDLNDSVKENYGFVLSIFGTRTSSTIEMILGKISFRSSYLLFSTLVFIFNICQKIKFKFNYGLT
jgi:hypothetical protein